MLAYGIDKSWAAVIFPQTLSTHSPGSPLPPQGLTGTAVGGRRDPINIGTLRDSVAFNEAEEAEKKRLAAQTPKARGLVRDTVDPRLKKAVAK